MHFLIVFAISLLTINAESSREVNKTETSEKPQTTEQIPKPNARIQSVPSYEPKDDYSIYDQITKQLFHRVAKKLKNDTNPLLEYKENKVQEKLFTFVNNQISEVETKIQHLFTAALKFYNNEGFKAGYVIASVSNFKTNLNNILAEVKSREGELDELSLIEVFEQLDRAEKKLDVLLADLIRTWRHREVEMESRGKNFMSEYYLGDDLGKPDEVGKSKL